MQNEKTYETAQAVYNAACEALVDVEARASQTFASRSDLRSKLEALKVKRRKLLTEAAVDGPSGGNAKDQAANKAAIEKVQGAFAEIEESANVFDVAIAQAADRVLAAHIALDAAIREKAKTELDAVCAELRAVATPLIEKALALYPPANHWYSDSAKSLLERLKLVYVNKGQGTYERQRLPSAAQKRKDYRPPVEERKPFVHSKIDHGVVAERLNQERDKQRDAMFGVQR